MIRRRLTLLPLLLVLSAACDDEPPLPPSNLLRPSAMVYIERSAERADLLVADAEAEGVRVMQFVSSLNSSGGTTIEATYVPAPAMFFPLAIPAAEFPTRLAVSTDGNRAFALSPVSKLVHVLDTREAAYDISGTAADTYFSLATLDLEALRVEQGLDVAAVPLGPDAIPVDVLVLPNTSSASLDLVAVLYDRVLEPVSMLVVYSVARTGTEFSVSGPAQTSTVAPSPRRLVRREVAPAGILIPSASSSTVSFIATARTASAALGAHQILDAGGPTLNIVDAGPVGAVALRMDRASGVVFDLVGGSLERANRIIESPYLPDDERGTPEAAGRVDYPEQPAVAGAYGQLPRLPDSLNLMTEPQDIVAVSHVNADVSFLVGDPLNLSVREAAVELLIERLKADGTTVAGCTTTPRQSCVEEYTAPDCAVSILSDPLSLAQTFRIQYEGALVLQTEGGVLKAPQTSTTGEVLFTLRDSLIPDLFGERMVAPGQKVLLHYAGRPTCGADEIVAINSTGDVVAVSPDRPELTVKFAADAPISSIRACPDQDITLFRYEVYPEGKMVFVERRAQIVGGIYDVQPNPAGGEQVVITTGPVALTLEAPTGFTCTTTSAAGSLCRDNRDCGNAVCSLEDRPPAESEEALRVPCRSYCEPCLDVQTCFRSLVRRSCSGVDIEVNPSAVTRVEPEIRVDGTSSNDLTLPDDVVFTPIADGWLTSYPGSRAMGLVRVGTDEEGNLRFESVPDLQDILRR